MKRARVLVTGASGLLGGRLAVLLAPGADVVCGRHRAPGPDGLSEVALDLLSLASLEAAFASARPTAVVHCAALADADACERDPEAARRHNVEGSAHLARLCRRAGTRLVALSTDLVLGGHRAWSAEDAPADSALVYARTKREAEAAVLAEAPGSAVVRVALVVGRGHGPRRTASEGIADALRAGRTLRLFTDQHRTPIDPESVADLVARLLDSDGAGRFHAGGPERVSRYDLGRRVAAVFDLPAEGLVATRQDEATTGAPRPADVSMDSGRARRELGWVPRALDLALADSRP
jgi:dTDP-4-dehydrorhamnose reductase